jgi:GNAT superfamily N-acetyltransferase
LAANNLVHVSLVRPAVPDDIPELIRHRELLFTALGRDTGRAEWREAVARVYADLLGRDTTSVLVIESPDGDRIAASGVGQIDQRLPGPETPNGLWGHVSNMVTDPAHRRRGHARAILLELLAWFQDREVHRIDLHGSRDGTPLYRQFGFTEHPGAVALTRWAHRS